MLAVARRRLGDTPVTLVETDLFDWRPDDQYDTVFYAFWLSHVPPGRFWSFWETVRDALAAGGRVLFVDTGPKEGVRTVLAGAAVPTVERQLRTGPPRGSSRCSTSPKTSRANWPRSAGWRTYVPSVESSCGQCRPRLKVSRLPSAQLVAPSNDDARPQSTIRKNGTPTSPHGPGCLRRGGPAGRRPWRRRRAPPRRPPERTDLPAGQEHHVPRLHLQLVGPDSARPPDRWPQFRARRAAGRGAGQRPVTRAPPTASGGPRSRRCAGRRRTPPTAAEDPVSPRCRASLRASSRARPAGFPG